MSGNSSLPPRRTALHRTGIKPGVRGLTRTEFIRRAAIVRTRSLARSVRPSVRKAKTRVGEFPAKVRKLAYARWDGRCGACGDWMHPKAFELQHRRARAMGGSTDPLAVHVANAVAVHRPCHERIEANPTQALYDGFRIPQGSDPGVWPIRIWTGEFVLFDHEGGWRPVAAEPEES